MAGGSKHQGNIGMKHQKQKERVKVGFGGHASDPIVSLKLAFCALAILCIIYSAMLWVARRSIYGMHVTPLPQNASLDKFSEGRTMKHIWHLADEIGIRQEGSIGLMQAADYLKSELKRYKQRASSSFRVEIDESFVYGSFAMNFLKHNIALAYKNHTNLAIRISAAGTEEDAPAVLVNGHFDSAIGSPGASDCASCVATMLEAVRLIIDTNWVPPRPVIFLFNGAEELFMVACHGFMTTHKWRSTIGALINLESGGPGGPDLVCQSGPGSWPIEVYAKSVVYPMANTAAQDIFPYIPGDTDYRMFSEDYGDIPGLDIIMVLEGYVYHTPFDRPERMVPGGMQMRGENLMSLLRAFTSSSSLMNAKERAKARDGKVGVVLEKRPIFSDFLGWFMIWYPFKTAMVLHTLPLGFVFFIASLATNETSGLHHLSDRIALMLRGLLLHFLQLALGMLFPVVLAIIRLIPASSAMNWFAQPWLAILIYAPISFAGMLLLRATGGEEFIMKGKSKDPVDKRAVDWGVQWGALAMYSLGAAVGTHVLFGNGFLSFWWAIFVIGAYYLFQVFQILFGQRSLVSFSLYVSSLAFPIVLSLYVGGLFWQSLLEKMGMNGTVPQPLGFYVADVIIAAVTGYVMVLCVGPLIPAIGAWLASPHIVRFLIYVSVCSAAVFSQFFPYSPVAPKRILLQHTLETDGNQIVHSHYDLAVFDANPLPFVFKHIPAVPQFLGLAPSVDIKTIPKSPVGTTWMALYPISELFVESFRFPADSKHTLNHHPTLPHITVERVESNQHHNRRIYMELDLGSVFEIWAAVLNVTGPLTNWSFADQQLPAPEAAKGRPPSYICRLSGRDSENWKFWLEANESTPLRVDLAVLDQQIEEDTQKFVSVFPPWTAIIAASSYLSSYTI